MVLLVITIDVSPRAWSQPRASILLSVLGTFDRERLDRLPFRFVFFKYEFSKLDLRRLITETMCICVGLAYREVDLKI